MILQTSLDFKNGDVLHNLKYYGNMMCEMRSERMNMNYNLNN